MLPPPEICLLLEDRQLGKHVEALRLLSSQLQIQTIKKGISAIWYFCLAFFLSHSHFHFWFWSLLL